VLQRLQGHGERLQVQRGALREGGAFLEIAEEGVFALNQLILPVGVGDVEHHVDVLVVRQLDQRRAALHFLQDVLKILVGRIDPRQFEVCEPAALEHVDGEIVQIQIGDEHRVLVGRAVLLQQALETQRGECQCLGGQAQLP